MTTAFPIEHRVKSWESISEKCERSRLPPVKLSEITDVAGLRIVVLFQRDMDKVSEIIAKHFDVLKKEDTQSRLALNEFGYGSIHFEVTPKGAWLEVPTMAKFKGLQAELQVRTAAQHIWASASHLLQYKKEADVPKPLVRAINRVAALLEFVDLEFERVLAQRSEYTDKLDKTLGLQEPLNAETVKRVLDECLPMRNKTETENYAEFLDEVRHFEVHTVGGLKDILTKQQAAMEKAEARTIEQVRLAGGMSLAASSDRIGQGVYFTHVGLARQALRAEFGEKYDDYLRAKNPRPPVLGRKDPTQRATRHA